MKCKACKADLESTICIYCRSYNIEYEEIQKSHEKKRHEKIMIEQQELKRANDMKRRLLSEREMELKFKITENSELS